MKSTFVDSTAVHTTSTSPRKQRVEECHSGEGRTSTTPEYRTFQSAGRASGPRLPIHSGVGLDREQHPPSYTIFFFTFSMVLPQREARPDPLSRTLTSARWYERTGSGLVFEGAEIGQANVVGVSIEVNAGLGYDKTFVDSLFCRGFEAVVGG